MRDLYQGYPHHDYKAESIQNNAYRRASELNLKEYGIGNQWKANAFRAVQIMRQENEPDVYIDYFLRATGYPHNAKMVADTFT